jgi:cytochrome P450
LARAEARIAVGVLLDTLHDITLDEDNEFCFEDSFVLRGLKSLVIRAVVPG